MHKRLGTVACIATTALVLTSCGINVMTKERSTISEDQAGMPYHLPQAVYTISISQTEKCEVKLKVGDAPKYMPDPAASPLFLSYNNKPIFSSNTMVIETDQNGLLKTVNGTSENKTVDVVSQAFAFAKQVAADSRQTVKTDGPPPKCVNKAFSVDTQIWLGQRIDGSLNKALEPQLDTVKKNVLEPFGLQLDVKYSTDEVKLPSDVTAALARCSNKSGVCTRYAKPFQLEFSIKRDSQLEVLQRVTLMGPDVDTTYLVPMNDKVFSKFDVKLEFSSGLLTRISSNDNSEALAALAIPSAVVAGILGLETPASTTAVSPTKK